MCLYIEKDAVALVAEEDIEVYKVLRYMPEHDQYDSPYQEYVYPMDVNPPMVHSAEIQTHASIIGITKVDNQPYYHTTNRAIINIGYTSPTDIYIRTTVVEEGLHTFASLDDAKEYAKRNNLWVEVMKVVRCTIPKGAEYYKGFWPFSLNGQENVVSYASSQLIALEVIPNELPYDKANDIIPQ